MKVNQLKMLQSGGYVTYQPNPIVPQQAQAAPEQQGAAPAEDDGYLDKNILEKMLGNGITTDVMQYSDQIEAAHNQYARMNDMQRNTYKGRQIRSLLKGNLGQLNELIRSKNMFDDSIKNAKSNDALEEYAVTNNHMIVKDASGNINEVSFADFAKNKDKYQALTNAQLAEEREYNKQLTGNPGIFSILNYGKGISKVQDEVLKIVSSIGSTKSSTQNGEYQANAQDMQELVQAAKNGVFKVKSGQSGESNSSQIEAAKQAMWYNLSDNSKAVLKARAAAITNDPSKIDKVAQGMAASLLDPHLSTTSSVTYDESMKLGKDGKAHSANEKLTGYGMFGMAFGGNTDTVPISQIGPAGVKIDGSASIIPTSAYLGKDNARVKLTNTKLGDISQLSKAFVANGDKVDPNLTVITGDAYVSKELPYTTDENGNYKIDYEGAKKYAIFDEAAKAQNLKPGDHKYMELAREYGVDRMKVSKFVIAEAQSYDPKSTFWSDRDDKFYEEIDGADKEALGQVVDPDSKTVRKGLDNTAHKHLIFIPARSEAAWNAMDGHDAKIPESAYALQGGYNSGIGGNNILQGQSILAQPPLTGQEKARYSTNALN